MGTVGGDREEDVAEICKVTVQPAGWVFPASPARALLASAARAGVVLPSSCRNGTCRACLCRLVQGQVRYSVEWPGLSAEEKQEGFILPCVAHPRTALVIEAPAARRRD
jgi:ferredoxin